jgi:hypothetical protein
MGMGGVWGNELEKLRCPRVWSKDRGSQSLLKYSVLITYTHTSNIEKVYSHVMKEWEGTQWPLLLILIDLEESKKFASHKEFRNIQMSVFGRNGHEKLRLTPAFP